VDVDGLTVADEDRESVGPTTGAPTIGTAWNPTERSPVELTSGHAPEGDAQVLIDADTADSKDVRIGERLTVIGQEGSFPVEVVGIVTFTTTNPGAALVFFDTEAAQTRLLGDPKAATSISLDAAEGVSDASGTSADDLRAGLEQTLDPYPQVQVRDIADYKELVHSQIAVLLYLVYALLGLAIIIAVLGVVNTLALSVVERTREIGLLRAIGLARRQLRRMIRPESVVIAVFGAVLGLALGLVWGVCTQQVLALQGMTALAIPSGTIVAVVIGSAVVGVVAALLPALRASRMNVLAAIAHE
jgi:putative ABC transport system permease protein